jgi:hypothetical protein
LWRFTMNTKPFLTVAVASSLSLLSISFARGEEDAITDISKVDAITDISRTGTDITISWTAFGGGSPPYDYTVEHTDDLTTLLPWTEKAVSPPSALSWTDPAVLGSEARRFYRVKSVDAVGGKARTYPVGFVQVEVYPYGFTPTTYGMNMISVPLLSDRPGPPPPDMDLVDPVTLTNKRVGNMIAKDLPEGSLIVRWDPDRKRYDGARLYDVPPNVWVPFSETFDVSFDLGEGFWLFLESSPSIPTIVFLGWVPTADSIPVTFRKGLTMFNWPYPTTLDLNDSTLKDVGQRALSAPEADVVYKWDHLTSSYTSAFLLGGIGLPPALEGKWWDTRAEKESEIDFKPGGAMWYLRRPATSAVWVCTRPYSF